MTRILGRDPELYPLYSQGFFTIIPTGEIIQVVDFRYYEKTGYYERILRNKQLLRREKELLRKGMENILGEEKIIINGKNVSWRVLDPNIILHDTNHPEIVFHVAIEFEARPGRNVYEEYYEKTVVEYPYTAFWILPGCMKLLDVEASGEIRVTNEGRLLVISVKKGETVDGYEGLIFDNKCHAIPGSQ
ncbi:MAG: hypothetical protein GSR75_01165 [Desulfurococcales archaeon]|nr:hypothetical protein [Desulfurococcales archaeon]